MEIRSAGLKQAAEFSLNVQQAARSLLTLQRQKPQGQIRKGREEAKGVCTQELFQLLFTVIHQSNRAHAESSPGSVKHV